MQYARRAYDVANWEVNIENRSGPRTEPWGTPVASEVFSDCESPTTTRWTRPDKYELIQPIALPETPKLAWSLDQEYGVVMVSKAALKSSDTSTVGWLVSAAV